MKSDLGLGRFGLGKMVVPPGVIGGVLGIGASPDDMANRPPWGTGRGSDRPTSLPSDMVIVIWCGGSWGGGEAHLWGQARSGLRCDTSRPCTRTAGGIATEGRTDLLCPDIGNARVYFF